MSEPAEYKELAARLRALADERDRDPTADIREAASAIEALEAERDEAAWNALDTFSREYHEAYHCDPVAMANGRNNWRKAAEAAEAAEARCKRLEEALRPFAGERLPSSKRSEISRNEWGLRCLMSPLEIARQAARLALQEGAP